MVLCELRGFIGILERITHECQAVLSVYLIVMRSSTAMRFSSVDDLSGH